MTELVEIPIIFSDDQAKIPQYTRSGDAAVDLRAMQEVVLAPFERVLIPTGIHVAIPEGYAGLVLPRSGLAIKQGLSLMNSPGLIDSNYRGEIQLIAVNLDPLESISINAMDRVAQFLVIKIDEMRFLEHAQLEETSRCENGFGSSGIR